MLPEESFSAGKGVEGSGRGLAMEVAANHRVEAERVIGEGAVQA